MSDESRFKFDYEVTPGDFRDWNRSRRRGRWERMSTIIKVIASIVLLAFGIRHFIQEENTPGTALVMIAVFLHHPLSWLAMTIMSRSHVKASVTLDETEIASKSMGYTTRLYWSMLSHSGEAVEHHGFFVFNLLMQATYIPKRAFESAEQMQAFREFVRRKMGERCRFEKTSSGTQAN